ncbi:MAG: carboxypeptidase-like regulatory domain-containing protein [Bryobacteraceae bacterium]
MRRFALVTPKRDLSPLSIQDGDGTFHFSYLPVGEYDLHITARGFASFNSSGIRVDVNRTISLPVALQIGPSSSPISPSRRMRPPSTLAPR